jgi:hypothetical protein
MASMGIAVVRQYERGVVFRLGRLRGVRKPGFRFMIPIADRMTKVSLRTVTMPVPGQQVITQDNVSIGVAAVAYFRRVDAVKSIVEIEDVAAAVRQIAQTTVRNIVGRSLLDQVLTDTQTLNLAIREILDRITQQWGVQVFLVELKDIELPPSMQRAMARQAEAEREKRAKIIAADGEARSAGRLAEAADVIGEHPIALQLRNLQILSEIAAEKNSTIVFPAQFLDSARAIAEFVAGEARAVPSPGGSAAADPSEVSGAAAEQGRLRRADPEALGAADALRLTSGVPSGPAGADGGAPLQPGVDPGVDPAADPAADASVGPVADPGPATRPPADAGPGPDDSATGPGA